MVIRAGITTGKLDVRIFNATVADQQPQEPKRDSCLSKLNTQLKLQTQPTNISSEQYWWTYMTVLLLCCGHPPRIVLMVTIVQYPGGSCGEINRSRKWIICYRHKISWVWQYRLHTLNVSPSNRVSITIMSIGRPAAKLLQNCGS